METPNVIAIVGPTASGKTSLSITLAERFDGEVISCDSRQVYRGMDLGTGKVNPDEMRGIPHHLLDVADPREVYTAADFERDATAAVTNITQRGRIPIIAGGTFFYLDILRGKMAPAPVPPNAALRLELATLSDEALLARLQATDPRRAANIEPENRRRVIRALEIIDALGAVPEPVERPSPYEWLILGIEIDHETLHHNIAVRLRERIDDGMIEEVERLHANGFSYARLDELGLEYRYIARYLQGELDRDTMLETLETKIRQYAKRQLTWLKRDSIIEWVHPQDLDAIKSRVREFLHTES